MQYFSFTLIQLLGEVYPFLPFSFAVTEIYCLRFEFQSKNALLQCPMELAGIILLTLVGIRSGS